MAAYRAQKDKPYKNYKIIKLFSLFYNIYAVLLSVKTNYIILLLKIVRLRVGKLLLLILIPSIIELYNVDLKFNSE